MSGWGLLLLTLLLVLLGCALYNLGAIGWAQLGWVLASGTAGAGIVRLIDDQERR